MENKPFKKAKAGIERAFILPAAPIGHIAFAILFAVNFVNFRIFGMGLGAKGFLFDACFGVLALLMTAIVLNLLPAKWIRDEGAPQ